MKMVEWRPGIWPANTGCASSFELCSRKKMMKKEKLSVREEGEKYQAADSGLGREYSTTRMAGTWPRRSLVGSDARCVAEPSYRSDRPVIPVGPVRTWGVTVVFPETYVFARACQYGPQPVEPDVRMYVARR